MDRTSLVWQKISNLWMELRHTLLAFAVFINGLLIFNTVWGMSVNLIELFQVQNFTGIHWANIANGPWFLLGIFLMFNAFGLLYRARIAWAVSIVLLFITLIFTWHFYPHLTSSITLGIVTLVGLVLLGRDFNRSSATAGGIFALISFTVLVFYATYGAMYFGEGFHPAIHDLSTAFYFSIVTMTTVGYGDIIPITQTARLFTISVIIAGITVFATSVTTVFGPIIHGGLNKLIKGSQQQMNRKDHFIVCGTSILAISTVGQLKQRGFDVTVLTNQTEADFPQIELRAGCKLDILSGDSTDNTQLELAGLKHCKALLALTDNDASNAFIVLSAKELSPTTKTVLSVNDAKNMNKVKQVKADVVLSPQLFGSEILASILAGEPLNNENLLAMLLESSEGLMDTDK